MNGAYHRPPPTGDGLRLHLNENTAGCSPRVLEESSVSMEIECCGFANDFLRTSCLTSFTRPKCLECV